MPAADDIARIRTQEAALVFTQFDEGTAFEVGSALRQRAIAENLGIAIEIRFWDRPLFYAALPGSSGVNPDWLRRKGETVKRWAKSSYRVMLEQRSGERLLSPTWGLQPSEYAFAGGGFPITAKGFGVIGAIAVSGLAERLDHMVVVDAICDHLGLPRGDFALPEE